MYVLTAEGKEYLTKGLPERQLLQLLAAGPKPMDAVARMPRIDIAIGWARRNRWISVSELEVKLTELGERMTAIKSALELALASIEKTGVADPESIAVLISRNLIAPVKPTIVERLIGKKPATGEIAQLTPGLLKTGKWRGLPFRRYDVGAPAPQVWPGKRHIVAQFLETVRRIWLEMGFKEMTGPMAEAAFWNFDALYQPQDHPARDMADTFYLNPPATCSLPDKALVERVGQTHANGWTTGSSGWKYGWSSGTAAQACLRTHTTAVSARTLASLKKTDLPAKYFSIGRCFRNETLDWKHLCEFYQVDGIVADESVTFRHLLGYLKRFYTKLGFPHARFRPSYFPYTEMSTEIEVWDPVKKAWLELGGAGNLQAGGREAVAGHRYPGACVGARCRAADNERVCPGRHPPAVR